MLFHLWYAWFLSGGDGQVGDMYRKNGDPLPQTLGNDFSFRFFTILAPFFWIHAAGRNELNTVYWFRKCTLCLFCSCVWSRLPLDRRQWLWAVPHGYLPACAELWPLHPLWGGADHAWPWGGQPVPVPEWPCGRVLAGDTSVWRTGHLCGHGAEILLPLSTWLHRGRVQLYRWAAVHCCCLCLTAWLQGGVFPASMFRTPEPSLTACNSCQSLCSTAIFFMPVHTSEWIPPNPATLHITFLQTQPDSATSFLKPNHATANSPELIHIPHQISQSPFSFPFKFAQAQPHTTPNPSSLLHFTPNFASLVLVTGIRICPYCDYGYPKNLQCLVLIAG